MFDKILRKYADNESGRNFSGYNLNSICRLLELLGNPHENFKTVHVAGTNGKGTTSMILAQITSSSGYRTGLFTSPHLLRLNERIKVDSEDIKDSSLSEYSSLIDSIVVKNKDVNPTFFDFITALAFLYFSDLSVDIAVIETGLGGRLDSTNVIIPELSVITDISLDHTAILGSTIEEITAEKCGIVKDHVPVITSNRDERVMKIITKSASSHGSSLTAAGTDFYSAVELYDGGKLFFDYFYPEENIQMQSLSIPLQPAHQIVNASLAVTAAFLLRNGLYDRIDPLVIRKALLNLSLPGRFEIMRSNPLIIFDPAHNIDALSVLMNTVKKLYFDREIHLILSVMADKVTDDVKNFFSEYRSIIAYYPLDDKRAYIAGKDEFPIFFSSRDEVEEYVISSDASDVFLFTGSFRIYEIFA